MLHKLYLLWALLAISLSLMVGGLSPENLTRLLVLAFLGIQFLFRKPLSDCFAGLSPGPRFVLLGTLLAAAVEGFHMISKPVFESLQIQATTTPAEGLWFYGLDLLFTIPAYLVIFSVIYWFLRRYNYPFWHYTLLMGFAQVMGDGGIFFFLQAPAMLLFLPYPTSNYHALNVLPYLNVHKQLDSDRPYDARAMLALPAVIATYLCCGAIIQWLGRLSGLIP